MSNAKLQPKVLLSLTSSKPCDDNNNSFAIRLLKWPDGKLSVTVGLAKKEVGKVSMLVRKRYTNFPVACLKDLESIVPAFCKKSKELQVDNVESD